MKHDLKILILSFFVSCVNVFSQLTINVTSVPDNTPVGDDIYLASNFNGWNPNDTNFILTNNGDGTYQITFTPTIGILTYKFTRGDWNSVEGDAQGQEIPNRTLNYTGSQQTVDVSILSWKDIASGNTTATENVIILDENFNIPQLNRTRRIWMYLPPDYDATSNTYPVLYMQDGQNLFDLYTSFSGEWEVDESLNELFNANDDGVIVVGIDNGGGHRIDEYSPWVNVQYGGGEGDDYVNFIVETLKPYIDTNFRTKSDRLNTGIMGSSLGALISFYAAIEHQDVFSKVGVFSPSFWFSDEVYTHVETTGKQHDMSFYFLGGELEGGNLIQNMEDMVTTLQNVGFDSTEITMLTHQDGQHSEWYWRREFSNAYLWLFNNDALSLPESFFDKESITMFPNPFSDTLVIKSINEFEDTNLEVYNILGELIYTKSVMFENEVDVSNLKNGLYIFKIVKNDKVIFSQKMFCVGK